MTRGKNSSVRVLLGKVKVKQDRAWSSKWMGDRFLLSFAPALRSPRSQILCRLYKRPSDETMNRGPPVCIRMQKDQRYLLGFFPLFFFFTLTCERIFIKTHNIGIRFVMEPENVLFAGVCEHFSPRKFYRLGQ